jgi:hypothetical protein
MVSASVFMAHTLLPCRQETSATRICEKISTP